MNDADAKALGSLLLAGDTPLVHGDAAAAILLLPDGRYVLQERDRLPAIWWPGHWGCFGGSVEGDEEPEAALRRELMEELEFAVRGCSFFVRSTYDYGGSAPGRTATRTYFVVPITDEEFARVRLREGRSVGAFTSEAMFTGLRLAPYDGFVLFLHAARSRVRLPADAPERAVASP